MQEKKFVGRAGEKLDFALEQFKITVQDKICADFGSSVGGFVDCLLKRGSSKVYSVETGYGVLDWGLRNNPQVVVLERTNAMHVVLPERVDLISVDVSWTRQINILPNVLNNLKDDGIIISLIKPHYEADKKFLRGGKLEEEMIKSVVDKTTTEILDLGLILNGIVESPILGDKGGNKEYLIYLKKLIN